MQNNLNKAAFCRMFDLNKKFKSKSNWSYYKYCTTTKLNNNIITVYARYEETSNFVKELMKNDFVISPNHNDSYKRYIFYIAEKYIEYIKSIFEMIESPNTDNAQLAFQLMQNIKTFHKDYKQK